MKKYRHLSFAQFLFETEGSVILRIWKEIVIALVVAAGAVLLHEFVDAYTLQLNGHSLLIFPLAFLIVFRTNLSYARYMDGRSNFGAVLSGSSTLVRMSSTYLADVDGASRDFARLCAALIVVVRHDLFEKSVSSTSSGTMKVSDRDRWTARVVADAVPFLRPAEESSLRSQKKNRPLLVIKWLSVLLRDHGSTLASQRVSGNFESQVTRLYEGWKGCRKILETPLPFPYAHILRWLLILWTYSVPFPLVSVLSKNSSYGPWAAIPIMFIVSFALFGINAAGLEIEDPFGNEANDLPLGDYEKRCLDEFDLLLGGPPRSYVMRPEIVGEGDGGKDGSGERLLTSRV